MVGIKFFDGIPEETIPKSVNGLMARAVFKSLHSDIEPCHCKICGDTEEDGKLYLIRSGCDLAYFCEFCFEMQCNM